MLYLFPEVLLGGENTYKTQRENNIILLSQLPE
jgi:hypothetical protein